MDSSTLWLAIVYKEQKIVLSHKQASYIIVEGNLFWIIEINGKHVTSGVIIWPGSYENLWECISEIDSISALANQLLKRFQQF